MAAKFDGKHARANFWVTQQNLAKQKGGYPGYQFNERKRAKPVNPVGRLVTPAPAPAAPATTAPVAGDAPATQE